MSRRAREQRHLGQALHRRLADIRELAEHRVALVNELLCGDCYELAEYNVKWSDRERQCCYIHLPRVLWSATRCDNSTDVTENPTVDRFLFGPEILKAWKMIGYDRLPKIQPSSKLCGECDLIMFCRHWLNGNTGPTEPDIVRRLRNGEITEDWAKR